jgi:4-amino-4-deoxy-L-arabinose transferase-like glycosyltransferase
MVTRDALRDGVALLGLLVVGFLVRMPGLDERELWIDEANSVLIARESVPDIVGALRVDGNPPLYYVLLHTWMSLFGQGEVAVRALSLVLGLALVLVVALLGRAWFGRVAGGLAAFLVATSPLHVYYSREARMYTMVAVLAVLAIFAVDRLLVRRDRTSVVLAALALASVALTHNYGLFLLPFAPLACLLVREQRGRGLLVASLASVLALTLVSPWLPVVVGQARSGVGDWIPELFVREVERTPFGSDTSAGRFLGGAVRTLEVMAPGASYPSYLRKLPVLGRSSLVPLFFIGLALLAGILPHLASSPEKRREEIRRVVLLLFGLVVPIALPLAYSAFVKPVYLVGRYEMIGFGALALLAGRGMALASGALPWAGARVVAASVLASLAGVLAFTSLQPYLFGPNPLRPHATRIARLLAEKGREGDIVLFTEATRATAEYALSRRGLDERFELRSFPADSGLHRGWYDPEEYRGKRRDLDDEARELTRALYASLPIGGRLFVLYEGRYPDLHQTLLGEIDLLFGTWRPELSKGGLGVLAFVK